MAKLQKGTTFVDGQSYNAAAFNNLVDSATILPGIITEQAAAACVAADQFLFNSISASGLKLCTLQDIINAIPANAAAGTASLRQLGQGATQACQGNDGRIPSTLAAGVPRVTGSTGLGGADIAGLPQHFAFACSNLASGLNVNWNLADVFYTTAWASTGANHTYTFSNATSGRAISIIMNLSGYTGTLTWPAMYGAAPAQSSAVMVYTFISHPNGIVGMSRALT